MSYAVLKGAGYILVHTPEMVIHNGTTQTTERITNPKSEYLKNLRQSLRTFDQVLNYAPNQTYIGSMTPEQLKEIPMPWYDKQAPVNNRFGKLGEIMPEAEFVALLQIVDTFDLVKLETNFAEFAKTQLAKHPLFIEDAAKIKDGETAEYLTELVEQEHAEGIYYEQKLVGCVKRAHDIDPNLNAHVLFENLVAKASAVLALRNLLYKNGLNPKDIDYVIECSEEACGDMNQRGGGNFAKSIAEMVGAANATGSDTRSFCAAPTHALIQAASLVKAGTYDNVVIVAGGATAKLGMNGKDHVKKGIPILEDVLGGFAVMIGKDDGISPILNTDLVGKHTVATGSAPQAVITSLVTNPLDKAGLKITDIDKYSVEMQNPDITKPAGAGDVPEANYKMIAALSVMRKEIERSAMNDFVANHGMSGFAPTQGHIPSGVPYLGFAKDELTTGKLNKVMIIGKGSLFLGRMTNLFDGVSIIVERNKGKQADEVAASPALSGKRRKIGLTTYGSEHGASNLINGAKLSFSQNGDFDIVLIGSKVDEKLPPGIEVVETAEDEMYKKMEELLDCGYIDGCVAMHYNFPIGVSTIGRAITPGLGKEMLIATTTGTSATDRVEAMIRNAVYGIAVAKALGVAEPTVGILNVDGARTVENALAKLKAGGYKVNFSASTRADGGAVMRGNDLLCGAADVMVTDTLTGNIMMKMLSSFTTGGGYESSGYGYGPGIGENYNRLVLILSRASGVPVVANAIKYAAQLAKGDIKKVVKAQIDGAKKAGLNEIIASLQKTTVTETVQAPARAIVTEEITGIDIMSLEDAVQELWKAGIYAESGMGCTGPVVLVNPDKHEKAFATLKKTGYVLE